MAKKNTTKSKPAKKKIAPKKKPALSKKAAVKKAVKKVTGKKTTKAAVSKPAVTKVKKKINKVVKPEIKKKSKKVVKKIVEKTSKVKVAKKQKEEEIQEITPVIKPAKKIKGYSKKDLEHFRQIIVAKQREITEQLQNLREQMLDPTTGEYINENSPYSLHMAEQGTDAMEREKTFLYAQRENKFLGYLEDALKRIDAGTYGICIECIDEPKNLCPTCPLISKARLEAVPHSQLCVEIKKLQEKIRR